MDFFGLGAGEIILIFIVVLIIFGPGKLPEFARKFGKAMNTLKQTSSELTSQITRELDEEEAARKSHLPNVLNSPDKKAAPPDTTDSGAGQTK